MITVETLQFVLRDALAKHDDGASPRAVVDWIARTISKEVVGCDNDASRVEFMIKCGCEDYNRGDYSDNCKDCGACLFCTNCKGCGNCSDCHSCRDCTNCTDCRYCENCNGCMNCYGCTDLVGKVGWNNNKPPA